MHLSLPFFISFSFCHFSFVCLGVFSFFFSFFFLFGLLHRYLFSLIAIIITIKPLVPHHHLPHLIKPTALLNNIEVYNVNRTLERGEIGVNNEIKCQQVGGIEKTSHTRKAKEKDKPSEQIGSERLEERIIKNFCFFF